MTKFEDVLVQYEPMISASIRKLHIYRDHESFRQAGRVALWQAWTRFDETKGNFTPYAYRSIRGAMLDELKRENHFEAHTSQMEDAILEVHMTTEASAPLEWSDQLDDAFERLTEAERHLIQWLFVEELSLATCAEKATISLAALTKRRQRLLAKLKRILGE